MNASVLPVKFEYIQLPALRFIGIDAWRTNEKWEELWNRREEILRPLEGVKGRISAVLPHIGALCHHDDGEVDVVNRYVVGNFFVADTPVPHGYDYYDLKPQTIAYAVFENMTEDEFWPRYEATRDKILADGVGIPYPAGYWHAELYFDRVLTEPPFTCAVLFACDKTV